MSFAIATNSLEILGFASWVAEQSNQDFEAETASQPYDSNKRARIEEELENEPSTPEANIRRRSRYEEDQEYVDGNRRRKTAKPRARLQLLSPKNVTSPTRQTISSVHYWSEEEQQNLKSAVEKTLHSWKEAGICQGARAFWHEVAVALGGSRTDGACEGRYRRYYNNGASLDLAKLCGIDKHSTVESSSSQTIHATTDETSEETAKEASPVVVTAVEQQEVLESSQHQTEEPSITSQDSDEFKQQVEKIARDLISAHQPACATMCWVPVAVPCVSPSSDANQQQFQWCMSMMPMSYWIPQCGVASQPIQQSSDEPSAAQITAVYQSKQIDG